MRHFNEILTMEASCKSNFKRHFITDFALLLVNMFSNLCNKNKLWVVYMRLRLKKTILD